MQMIFQNSTLRGLKGVNMEKIDRLIYLPNHQLHCVCNLTQVDCLPDNILFT